MGNSGDEVLKRIGGGTLKRVCHRFISIRGNPREIALGLFVGMSPYMMCHTVMAVMLASVLRWNKISAAAGVFITNPITAPFFYRITYNVGSALITPPASCVFPRELTAEAVLTLLRNAPELFRILTVGGVVTGIPLAIVGYYLSYFAILAHRRNKNPKENRR